MVINMMLRHKLHKPMPKGIQLAIEYAYLLLGAAIVAFAFNAFLLPNRIASGGVSGISTIFMYVFGFEPALTQWALNIPLFIVGVILLGRQFGIKTLVGTVFLPFFVFLTRNVEPVTNEPLLAALFGGIGVGVGLGLVFRGKASTGGTDLAAQIIHKYTGLTLGVAVLLLDGLVVTASAIAFDIEFALYALIGLYVTGKTIDLVQIGLGYAKVAYIISSTPDEIRQAILNDLDRGVTKISATGGYTESDRPVLMCVLHQTEVIKLKHLVRKIDADAFVIVHQANEVLGEGFQRE
jgi:uncharacterized membrane-anchored protein YitT (DUF2179 family)